jgi:hypothetical protein
MLRRIAAERFHCRVLAHMAGHTRPLPPQPHIYYRLIDYCCAGLPLKDFIAAFWRTWLVILAPFLLSPIFFID